MSADIFISYASQDAKIANTISAAIESRGFKCWISSRDILPGENFQSAIVRAIRSSKILLLVFTSNSNRSDEMTKELALASQQKLMVVPLRVEDVTPSDAFAYEFATRQWIDLFADWELAMNQLCTRLGAALANEPHSTDPIVLGKPASESQAARPAPVAVPSNPAKAATKAPTSPTVAKPAGKPGAASPLLKVAIGAAALIAAAAVAVPSLMKRSATTGTAATAVATPRPAAEPVMVVAVAPTATQPTAEQSGTATAAPADPAATPAETPAAATAQAPVAAVAAAPASGDATGKELPKQPAKPVERKKRVAQRSSSNVPY